MTASPRGASGKAFFSVGEAAKLLGVTVPTLRSMADRGDIPSARGEGNHRVFRASTILARAAAMRGTSRLTDGDREAIAMSLMVDGATDAAIVMQLRLPLKDVRGLRRALEEPTEQAARDLEDEDERATSVHRQSIESTRRRIAEKRAKRQATTGRRKGDG